MIALEVSTPVCLISSFIHPFTCEIVFEAGDEVDSDTLQALHIIDVYAKDYPTAGMMAAVSNALSLFQLNPSKPLNSDEILSLWFSYAEIDIIELNNSVKLNLLTDAISK